MVCLRVAISPFVLGVSQEVGCFRFSFFLRQNPACAPRTWGVGVVCVCMCVRASVFFVLFFFPVQGETVKTVPPFELATPTFFVPFFF